MLQSRIIRENNTEMRLNVSAFTQQGNHATDRQQIVKIHLNSPELLPVLPKKV